MNLTSWDLSYHTEAFVVIQTLIGGFLMGSIVVVKCIYKPPLVGKTKIRRRRRRRARKI